MGWTELLAVELASFGGGRVSPERLKTVARGSSEGSTGPRQHQQTTNAPPKQLLELDRHRRAAAGLRGSPESSGRGDSQRPAQPSFCRSTCSWGLGALVLGSKTRRGALYIAGAKGGRVAAGALWTRGERRREAPTRGGKRSASTQKLAMAAPASASARERSRVMGRGLWCGVAVGGDRWNEHARNRGQGAS